MSPVQRWDGHLREATDWNELRKDPELFFPNGNTLIYLYSRGRSQRGPSFRIPYEFLLYSGCRPLVEQSLISTLSTSPYDQQDDLTGSDESYLYLHAPEHLTREESFVYHVTTRNFFAWLLGVPIAGHDPVSALIALKDRMDVWRDEGSDNLNAICEYIREQGYGDVSQIKAQLSPAPKPTLNRDRSCRFEGTPTLTVRSKKPGSVAAGRQSLRKKVRFSESLHHRPHLSNLIRSHKKVQAPCSAPHHEVNLAAIAYKDTSADTAPSLVARQPKPRLTRSIGCNSNYTEIVIADYGNSVNDLSSMSEAGITPASASPSGPLMSKTSPSEAYIRRSPQTASSTDDTPPSPSLSGSTSSCHSDIPSLSSTYSTEEGESPILPGLPTLPPTYTLHNGNSDHNTIMERKQDNPEARFNPMRDSAPYVKILNLDTDPNASASQPDIVIDALISELESAGLGGKPHHQRVAIESHLSLSLPRSHLGARFAL